MPGDTTGAGSSAEATGALLGLDLKLGGAFAAYLVAVALALADASIFLGPRAELKRLEGKVLFDHPPTHNTIDDMNNNIRSAVTYSSSIRVSFKNVSGVPVGEVSGDAAVVSGKDAASKFEPIIVLQYPDYDTRNATIQELRDEGVTLIKQSREYTYAMSSE